jgi:hypothetical protein
MGERAFSGPPDEKYGYIRIDSLHCEGNTAGFATDESLLTVRLERDLMPGDSIQLMIIFYLKIPLLASRLGYRGRHYEIVQWYPKPCVFDEQGWHLNGLHALGEFYGEYGTFDVSVELPADYIVAATGENITDTDPGAARPQEDPDRQDDRPGCRRHRFRAENVHDFALVCDPEFIVDRLHCEGTDILVFCRRKNYTKWQNAGIYAFDALTWYNNRFGQYPYGTLNIVDGFFNGGMEYPNLVIIGACEDPLTRNFETIIIHEIAHQWFYGMLGSNEMQEAWLDEGLTTYAEIAYFEHKYGKHNSFFKSKIVPPLTRRYFHQLVYYLSHTNQIEKPVLTPAHEFVDAPLAYSNAAYSKPALFLINLEGWLGHDVFSKILQEYCARFTFSHPRTEDFIDVCEEVSGRPLKDLFCAFLNSTGTSDWTIARRGKTHVQIRHSGDFMMPVDVYIETDLGARIYRLDVPLGNFSFPEARKIKKVTIDPHGYSLESNYHNNHYPSKVEFKPFLSWPAFDAYQVFYVPYIWYDADDGLTPGLYMAGCEFIDFDFVKGRHQWVIGYIYGIKSGKQYYNFSYQTPILFNKGHRTRFAVRGSNSNSEDKYGIGFINNWSIPFTTGINVQLDNMLSYYDLLSFENTDSQHWELGRNVAVENILRFSHGSWKITAGLSASSKAWASDWEYLKATFSVARGIHTVIPARLRLFAGRIFGRSPSQEKLFLCGALRHTFISDLFFGQKGSLSPQEHIHITGDGNMAGYQTLHVNADELYCINADLPSTWIVRLFADAGYYRAAPAGYETAFDVGVRIVLGPVFVSLPIYTKTAQPWEFRWSVGF